MKILLDARKLGDGGIGTYLETLVDGLIELRALECSMLQMTLIVTPRWNALLSDPNHRWAGLVAHVCDDTPLYSLREYFQFPRKHRALIEAHDCFHVPHYTLPFGISVPKIVTIHDVIHVSHPDTVWHRFIGKRLIRSALRRAERVITVSQSSAKELTSLFTEASDKIRVVRNAVSNVFRKRSSNVSVSLGSAANNYMLFVGSERPHKGFSCLLEAWKEFNLRREQKGQEPFTLVAIGDAYSAKSESQVKTLGIEEFVHFFGPASDDELAALYEKASGLVMPSHVEGFGLPAVEAMWFACPVICRPIESLREVCGDSAWYAADTSIESLTEVLLGMSSDDEQRQRMVEAGRERVSDAKPLVMAYQTLNVYREAVGLDCLPPLGASSVPERNSALRAQGGR